MGGLKHSWKDVGDDSGSRIQPQDKARGHHYHTADYQEIVKHFEIKKELKH